MAVISRPKGAVVVVMSERYRYPRGGACARLAPRMLGRRSQRALLTAPGEYIGNPNDLIPGRSCHRMSQMPNTGGHFADLIRIVRP